MKSKFSDFDSSRSLTREQMKKVTGGVGVAGTRCTFYCCPSNCSGEPFLIIYGVTCSSNEQCQGAMSGLDPCGPNDYVAALCKG